MMPRLPNEAAWTTDAGPSAHRSIIFHKYPDEEHPIRPRFGTTPARPRLSILATWGLSRPDRRSPRCATKQTRRRSAAQSLAPGSEQPLVVQLAAATAPASGAASGAIIGRGGAANGPKCSRLSPGSNTTLTTPNAWRRGDIHHRNIADRCRVMRKLRDILQRQAMDRHLAIRAARSATT
jgi:hypothetical protein